jgi:uncharacterized protein (DUF2237 family)
VGKSCYYHAILAALTRKKYSFLKIQGYCGKSVTYPHYSFHIFKPAKNNVLIQNESAGFQHPGDYY